MGSLSVFRCKNSLGNHLENRCRSSSEGLQKLCENHSEVCELRKLLHRLASTVCLLRPLRNNRGYDTTYVGDSSIDRLDRILVSFVHLEMKKQDLQQMDQTGHQVMDLRFTMNPYHASFVSNTL